MFIYEQAQLINSQTQTRVAPNTSICHGLRSIGQGRVTAFGSLKFIRDKCNFTDIPRLQS